MENTSDLISRQAAIDALNEYFARILKMKRGGLREKAISLDTVGAIKALPTVQPERLTDDDFETIRIHLNAYKEKLCNQRRWEEAEEYQRIIDRFMAFAYAQPKHGHWECGDDLYENAICSCCKWDSGEPWEYAWANFNFCPNCGADMRGKTDAINN